MEPGVVGFGNAVRTGQQRVARDDGHLELGDAVEAQRAGNEPGLMHEARQGDGVPETGHGGRHRIPVAAVNAGQDPAGGFVRRQGRARGRGAAGGLPRLQPALGVPLPQVADRPDDEVAGPAGRVDDAQHLAGELRRGRDHGPVEDEVAHPPRGLDQGVVFPALVAELLQEVAGDPSGLRAGSGADVVGEAGRVAGPPLYEVADRRPRLVSRPAGASIAGRAATRCPGGRRGRPSRGPASRASRRREWRGTPRGPPWRRRAATG